MNFMMLNDISEMVTNEKVKYISYDTGRVSRGLPSYRKFGTSYASLILIHNRAEIRSSFCILVQGIVATRI